MSVPLVFLFIIGGVHLFGLLGVLYWPLILGTIYVLIHLYNLTIAALETRSSKKEEHA